MVHVRASGLILALYALRIQAAPTGEHYEVSILDLVRNGTIKESGTVTYQHSLPEPNKDNSYEVDGITFYRYPGGIDVHPDYWEERGITFHNNTNLKARQNFIPPITAAEPCQSALNQETDYVWQTQNWNTVQGNTHQISDPLCPPGSISKSYTISYSYQVNVNFGPDLKIPISWLDKLGFRAGFSYTWGNAVATSYSTSWTDTTQLHPFIEVFRPKIFVVNGIAQATVRDTYYNKVCSVSDWSHMSLHLPLVNKDNNDCQSSGSSCGADGTYDSCFFLGEYARLLCPGRNLGPTPNDRACPSYLYPSPFN